MLKRDGTDHIPTIRVKEIDVDVFLALCVSHSKLAQAEYKRNPGYNNEHFSHAVELSVIGELERLKLTEECFELMEAQ